jgi:hypothetical protein
MWMNHFGTSINKKTRKINCRFLVCITQEGLKTARWQHLLCDSNLYKTGGASAGKRKWFLLAQSEAAVTEYENVLMVAVSKFRSSLFSNKKQNIRDLVLQK